MFLFADCYSQDKYSFIENNLRVETSDSLGTENVPTLTYYHESAFTSESSNGITGYWYIGTGWAAGSLGLYTMPGDIFYGLYIGLDTDVVPRIGLNIYGDISDRFSFGAYVEKGTGDDNHWWDVNLKTNIIENESGNTFYLKLRTRREHGVGISIGSGLKISNNTLYLSFLPSYDWEAEDYNNLKYSIFAAYEF